MSITTYAILGLVVAVVIVYAVGKIKLAIAKKQNENEINRIKKQGAENAQTTAEIIAGSNQIKENANTGNHGNDLHTMGEQLHQYAGKK